jgi:hypothetical protein
MREDGPKHRFASQRRPQAAKQACKQEKTRERLPKPDLRHGGKHDQNCKTETESNENVGRSAKGVFLIRPHGGVLNLLPGCGRLWSREQSDQSRIVMSATAPARPSISPSRTEGE